ETTIPSIARYLGLPVTEPTNGNENRVERIDGFVNYQDPHQQPPSPEIQAIFDRISDTAKLILLSQPDDNGVVRFMLGDGNDNVNISLLSMGNLNGNSGGINPGAS